jgi:hypothetical protein
MRCVSLERKYMACCYRVVFYGGLVICGVQNAQAVCDDTTQETLEMYYVSFGKTSIKAIEEYIFSVIHGCRLGFDDLYVTLGRSQSKVYDAKAIVVE